MTGTFFISIGHALSVYKFNITVARFPETLETFGNEIGPFKFQKVSKVVGKIAKTVSRNRQCFISLRV